MIHGKGYMML
uniref:Uncharacterized protein n=1 Tax=Anguilla anguilla TaxID=7936 RepID=A0A0E9PV97_ANGAN